WRDVLAFTWRIRTVDGADAIVGALTAQADRVRPAGLKLDPNRTMPRRVTRVGTETIEAIFRFETAQGRGSGVLRLTPDASNVLKAWTFHTTLDELKGYEETIGRRRPHGEAYSRDFRGPNWLDLRKSDA